MQAIRGKPAPRKSATLARALPDVVATPGCYTCVLPSHPQRQGQDPHYASSTPRATPSTGLMLWSETALPKATSAVTAIGTPFRMASSLPPGTTQTALEFVEMRELLPDNLALPDRLPQRISQPTRNPEQREIGSPT